jgi:hypothetical protein
MAKKPKAPAKPEPAKAEPRSLRPAVHVVAVLMLLLGGWWTIDWLGRAAGESVAKREAFRMKFEDLTVPTPPGLDRSTFLTEVKYLGQPPKEFSIADAAARTTLAEAFGRHPWVLAATPGQGSTVVELVFRKPILKVALTDGPPRLVDAQGTLLPVADWKQPIAQLTTPQPPPLTPSGGQWINPQVRRAVEFVNEYDAWNLVYNEHAWSFTRRDGKPYTLPRLEK